MAVAGAYDAPVYASSPPSLLQPAHPRQASARRATEQTLVQPDLHSISHLTRIGWWLKIAARIDETPVVGWVVGSLGVVWLPAVVALLMRAILDQDREASDSAVGWAIVLVALQVISGLVAHFAKKHAELSAGVTAVRALREFLDWMHDELFNSNQNSRITVMVR